MSLVQTQSDKKSKSWLKTLQFIPNGTQTLSKAPERYINGVYPKMLIAGHGAEVYDEDDNVYIDYISSLGAITLGHSNPAIDDAVKESISNGEILLSLPHPKEAELAEKLAAIIPGCRKTKFFKTGSEATSAAVRLARAYTGKTKILACGYNGWHDWCAIGYDRTAGIPEVLKPTLGRFTYNDLDSVNTHLKQGDIAAVIIEPVIFDEPKDNFLEKLIDLVHKQEGIVIFDEVVTGFRFGLSGISGLFGLYPDLVCLGKGMSNGYPMAALCGPARIMNVYEHSDFFVSGTFGGDLIGISAALAVIEAIKPNSILANGIALKCGFNKLCKDLSIEDISCYGYAPRTMFKFPTLALKSLFWQECLKRGILFGHANFPTMSHGESIMTKTLSAIYESLLIVKKYWHDPVAHLEGDLPLGVFAR